MSVKNKLLISSFNVKGFKFRNYEYIKKLYTKNDILFLQETWLHDFEFNSIGNVLAGSQYHCVSAMDSTDLSKSGRLYGGCAIVWKNFLPFNVKIIENQCKRICPIALNYNNNVIY